MPVAPLLITFIITAPFEEAVRQALTQSEGSPLIFTESPIAAGLFVLAIALMGFTFRSERRRRTARRHQPS